MKISKLFHWLYAILMLLPVAFIGVRCGYVMWNKNAKDSYSGNNDTYITQQVDGYLETSEVYRFTSTADETLFPNTLTLNVTEVAFQSTIISSIFNQQNNINRIVFVNNGTSNAYLSFYNGSSLINNYNIKNILCIFNFKVLDDYLIPSAMNTYFDYLDYTQNNYLDNAFEYSVNQLNETPLFNWAQSSFLITPFSYITGLFGIATESPINTLFSYWLSISICWLVFDLVMYVPLLVHRWLDKGVLE